MTLGSETQIAFCKPVVGQFSWQAWVPRHTLGIKPVYGLLNTGERPCPQITTQLPPTNQ